MLNYYNIVKNTALVWGSALDYKTAFERRKYSPEKISLNLRKNVNLISLEITSDWLLLKIIWEIEIDSYNLGLECVPRSELIVRNVPLY